ncbi:tetratricopeptide repeat protein [Pectobacterium cacticida]|uniref:tetratricopeptide repeat protein n=1 Tax=Pectobacterium cacticida TaxID=69221 RepID=UPI002FF041E5
MNILKKIMINRQEIRPGRAVRRIGWVVACLLLAGCSGTGAIQGSKSEGMKLARLLRDQGRLEAASEVYARLDGRGLLNGAEILEYATVAAPVRPPQEALALYGRARQALGGEASMAPQEALAICLGMGRAQLALGRNALAQQDFSCALKAQPDNAGALNGMGVVLDAAGKHAEARALFDRALHINPADTAAMNNLALSWLAEGDANKAIELLRTTDASNPTSRLNLALAYLYRDDRDDARDALASVAGEQRIDALLDELAARAQKMKTDAMRAETLLLSSRQPLQLNNPE